MYMSFFVVGVMLAVAGVVTVGFGIPINEFSLGNTLIITGAIAFVGGLILIGLGDVVRHLRQLSEGSALRPGRPSHDSFASAATPRPDLATAHIPFPRKPAREPREAAPIEQRLGVAPAPGRGDESFQRSAPEPQIVPERDAAPLSPREPSQERREPQFAHGDAERRRTEALRSGGVPDAPSLAGFRPERDTPRQNEAFESFWPAPNRAEPTDEAALDLSPEQQPVERPDPEEAGPHAVSILKSGVVDGMAYTLYSDGSIEAEMPEGTVRFASITELRAYLEQPS